MEEDRDAVPEVFFEIVHDFREIDDSFGVNNVCGMANEAIAADMLAESVKQAHQLPSVGCHYGLDNRTGACVLKRDCTNIEIVTNDCKNRRGVFFAEHDGLGSALCKVAVG